MIVEIIVALTADVMHYLAKFPGEKLTRKIVMMFRQSLCAFADFTFSLAFHNSRLLPVFSPT